MPREKMEKRIMVMAPQSLLDQIDAAARRRAISRSAYVRHAVTVALDADGIPHERSEPCESPS